MPKHLLTAPTTKLVDAGVYETFFTTTLDDYMGPAKVAEGIRKFNRLVRSGLAGTHISGLYLFGPRQTGKSLLASCVAKYALLVLNQRVLMVPFLDMMGSIKSGWTDDVDFAAHLKDLDLLVIDDIPHQRVSEFAVENMEKILTHRGARKLPTVLVSAMPLNKGEYSFRTVFGEANASKVDSEYVVISCPKVPEWEAKQGTLLSEEFRRA